MIDPVHSFTLPGGKVLRCRNDMGNPGRYPATMNAVPKADPRSLRPKRWQGGIRGRPGGRQCPHYRTDHVTMSEMILYKIVRTAARALAPAVVIDCWAAFRMERLA